MEWIKLLSGDKLGDVRSEVDKRSEGRSKFERDCDRIVFSSAFRRLQNKTQVIPLPWNDHVHNRLTHSLETCSIGRSLGTKVGTEIVGGNEQLRETDIEADDFANILAAACLAHDIGNPPLGHSGESAIREFFNNSGEKYICKLTPEQKNDFINFEGNALGFRILTHSFPHESDLKGGMGLTYATLATYTKYPKDSTPIQRDNSAVSEKKCGYFQAERETFEEIAQRIQLKPKRFDKYVCWYRHPLAFLSEAADDICNLIIDLEDGYRENLVTFEKVEEFLKNLIGSKSIDSRYESIYDKRRRIKFLRGDAINVLIGQIAKLFIEKEKELLEGKFDSSLINYIPANDVLSNIEKLDREKVYRSRQVLEIEAAGFEMLPGILISFLHALSEPESEKSKKILALIPKQYLNKRTELFNRAYEEQEFQKGVVLFDTDYENILTIVQFVASMTDNFAVDTYRLLKGISLPSY